MGNRDYTLAELLESEREHNDNTSRESGDGDVDGEMTGSAPSELTLLAPATTLASRKQRTTDGERCHADQHAGGEGEWTEAQGKKKRKRTPGSADQGNKQKQLKFDGYRKPAAPSPRD